MKFYGYKMFFLDFFANITNNVYICRVVTSRRLPQVA